MAKKSFGKFVALATLSGAVAAGVSYFLKYKSFNKELDKDFHDFEGDGEEDFDGSLPHESAPERTYVTLGEKKTENPDTAAEAAETAQETPREAAKEAAQEAPQETAKEAAQEAPQETAKEAAQEAPQETAEELKADTDTTVIEEDHSL